MGKSKADATVQASLIVSELRQAVKGVVPAGIKRWARARTVEGSRYARQLTAHLRVLPDFIIAGAQRAGTSSLYSYLTQHPDVLPAFRAEVHYFDVNFSRGIRWYKSFFPLAKSCVRPGGVPRPITGEKSPYYLFHPYALTRIGKLLPEARIIILLRNPVDRAFSHYQHEVRAGREMCSFEEAIAREAERLAPEIEKMVRDETYRSYDHMNFAYLAKGVYADQIQRCMEAIPRDRVHIIQSEKLFQDPEAHYQKTLEFLGLRDWNLQKFDAFNAHQYEGMNPATRQRLIEYYAPHDQRLYQILGTRFDWDHPQG